MSFYTGTQTELLYTLPAAVTKNTYTAQAILSALAASAPVATIPAGFFINPPASGPGKALYVKALGTIANTAAATFSPAFGIDPTPGTIANPTTIAAAYAPTAATTTIWNLEMWITARLVGQIGGLTLQIDGRWVNEATASAAAPAASSLATGFSASITGLQGQLAYSVELLGTWSVSNAANTTTLNQMLMSGLN